MKKWIIGMMLFSTIYSCGLCNWISRTAAIFADEETPEADVVDLPEPTQSKDNLPAIQEKQETALPVNEADDLIGVYLVDEAPDSFYVISTGNYVVFDGPTSPQNLRDVYITTQNGNASIYTWNLKNKTLYLEFTLGMGTSLSIDGTVASFTGMDDKGGKVVFHKVEDTGSAWSIRYAAYGAALTSLMNGLKSRFQTLKENPNSFSSEYDPGNWYPNVYNLVESMERTANRVNALPDPPAGSGIKEKVKNQAAPFLKLSRAIADVLFDGNPQSLISAYNQNVPAAGEMLKTFPALPK